MPLARSGAPSGVAAGLLCCNAISTAPSVAAVRFLPARRRIRSCGRRSPRGQPRRIRRTATVRGSYKDAAKRLTELLSQRDQGIDVEPNKLTIEQFLFHWLQNHRVEPQSRARYQQIIRRHILPTLGATKLNAVKPLHVQECQ